jgi:hypothetical protein
MQHCVQGSASCGLGLVPARLGTSGQVQELVVEQRCVWLLLHELLRATRTIIHFFLFHCDLKVVKFALCPACMYVYVCGTELRLNEDFIRYCSR